MYRFGINQLRPKCPKYIPISSSSQHPNTSPLHVLQSAIFSCVISVKGNQSFFKDALAYSEPPWLGEK